MDIPLPPGYASAAPFDKSRHKRLGVTSSAASFARALNAVYVTTAEFPRACHDYAIVFATDSLGAMVPLVLTGIDQGVNLYVNDAGEWLPDVYCPAFVRRYPFFTTTVSGDGREHALICVDETALDGGAPALINAAGDPTARWRERELLITEMDNAQRATARFCQTLQELDVLQSFDANFHPRGKPEVRLTGLRRVDEQKLRNLDDGVIAGLLRGGDLGRIHAHLLSLENTTDLLNRYVADGR